MRVSAREGLVVVLPPGVPDRHAERFVRARAGWAERQLRRVEDRRRLYVAGPDAWLPSEIDLPYCDRRWNVEYVTTEAAEVRASAGGETIRLSGAVEDGHACAAALRRWLSRQARTVLEPRLRALAEQHGATVQRVRVAGQRSRWGSYSTSGTVSLNRNLLFLPLELGDSVLLHELAHSWHADHSPRFWDRLRALDPDCAAHRRSLRRAHALVPVWADA
jgi:predicted metal-dependent hydrolase